MSKTEVTKEFKVGDRVVHMLDKKTVGVVIEVEDSVSIWIKWDGEKKAAQHLKKYITKKRVGYKNL